MNFPRQLITIAFIFASNVIVGQCALALSCDDIGDSDLIRPITSDGELLMEEFVFCIENVPITQVSTNGFQGLGIQAFARVELQDSAHFLFTHAILASSNRGLLLNSYLAGNCEELNPYKLQSDDYTPEVLDIEVEAGQDILLEIIIPAEQVIAQDSIIVTTSAMASLVNTEQTSSDGYNHEYNFRVVDRSIGYLFSNEFYREEEITLQVDFPYGTSLDANPEWLQTMIHHLGSGWETLLEEDVSIVATGGREAVFAKSGTDCEALVKTALPFYCIFENESGEKQLCNMLTELCPCRSNSIAGGTALPDAWFFSREATACAPTCSPNSNWGVGVTAADVTMEMKLRVKSDAQNGESLKVGITNFTDVLTGCFDPSFEVVRPAVATWGPAYQLFDVDKGFGFLSSVFASTCYTDSTTLDLKLFNPEERTYRIVFPNDGTLFDTPVPIEVVRDTSITVYLANSTNAMLTYVVQLIDEDGLIIDLTPFRLFPRLQVKTDSINICEFLCEDVQAFANIPDSLGVEYVWSTESFESKTFFCGNTADSLAVIASIDQCDIDTFVVPLTIIDAVKARFIKPSKICQDGINSVGTDRPVIIIDSIWGGRPPYLVNWGGPANWFSETEIDGKQAIYLNEELLPIPAGVFRFLCEVTDSEGCKTVFQERIRLVQDTTLDIGDFCADGFFDETDPLIVVELPDFQYLDVEVVEWLPLGNTVGFEGVGNTFVINEELTTTTTNVIALQANVQFIDGCSVLVNYDLDIFGADRDFTADVFDFEVDFTPVPVVGILSVFWNFGDGQTSSEFFPTHIYAEVGNYPVTMTIHTHCDTITIEKSVLVDGTAVQDLLLNNIKIYPNPSSGLVVLESDLDTDGTVVSVYNSYGKFMNSKVLETNSPRTELDLSPYPVGVYILQLMHEKNSIMKKVVKLGPTK